MIYIKVKRIVFLILFLILILSSNSFAESEISAKIDISNDFLDWYSESEEKRNETLMPVAYNISSKKEENKFDFFEILGMPSFKRLMLGSIPTSYRIDDNYYLEVKDQKMTQSCWAISLMTSLETNVNITRNKQEKYSAKHMEYATSNSFVDGNNQMALKRKVNEGGNSLVGLSYLTNGQGAVLDSELPFDYDMSPISIEDININPTTYVEGYKAFPSIQKFYMPDGKIKYYDVDGIEYSENELIETRNEIKKFIMEYGAINSYTVGSKRKYYSSANVIDAKSYFCNDNMVQVDHAISIVGWDDNYSKENFTGEVKPLTDGAYIVLNSYSENCFDNGYIYVSYEDANIEKTMYGITKTSDIDYDNIYQLDEHGPTVPINFFGNFDTHGRDLVYYSVSYDKKTSESEILDSVSVNIFEPSEVTVYYANNPENVTLENLKEIVPVQDLDAGYYKFDLEKPIKIGDKFTIVVKQKAKDGEAFILTESAVPATFFENVTAEYGKSKISLNGNSWTNLNDIGTVSLGLFTVDLMNSDFCIKAFTKKDDGSFEVDPEEPTLPENPETPEVNPEVPEDNKIESEIYKIVDDEFIMNVKDNTKISDFIENCTITGNYEIYNNDVKIDDMNELVKTNMDFKFGDKKYKIIVRGDINADGKISIVDLSKLIACFNENKGFELTGAFLKACDMSIDNRFSILDVSQFIVLFNSI